MNNNLCNHQDYNSKGECAPQAIVDSTTTSNPGGGVIAALVPIGLQIFFHFLCKKCNEKYMSEDQTHSEMSSATISIEIRIKSPGQKSFRTGYPQELDGIISRDKWSAFIEELNHEFDSSNQSNARLALAFKIIVIPGFSILLGLGVGIYPSLLAAAFGMLFVSIWILFCCTFCYQCSQVGKSVEKRYPYLEPLRRTVDKFPELKTIANCQVLKQLRRGSKGKTVPCEKFLLDIIPNSMIIKDNFKDIGWDEKREYGTELQQVDNFDDPNAEQFLCPNCKTPLAPGTKFCGACGSMIM